MTEKELLQKIQDSADSVNIPDSLSPDHITDQLSYAGTHRSRHVFTFFKKEKSVGHMHHRHPPIPAVYYRTAVVCILCIILTAAAWNSHTILPDENTSPLSDYSDMETVLDAAADTSDNSSQTKHIKHNAGSLYTIAKSEEEVYNTLKNSADTMDREILYSTRKDEAAVESSVEDSVSNTYSSTNLQTQGVDEADRVKTDGHYIYTVTGSKLLITDSTDGHLQTISSVTPELEASDSLVEFYVDGSHLLLIVQHYDTSIQTSVDITESSTEDAIDPGFMPLTNDKDITSYSMETKSQTILYTYSISDPAQPVLEGTYTQDGNYYTSRKIDDILYLFTDQNLSSQISYVSPKGEFIPCINDEKIPYNDIYLSDDGRNGLILSSVNLDHPDEIVDKLMILHNYVNIYVGNDTIYLYNSKYNDDSLSQTVTELARFSMKNGMLNAVSATSVNGEILDTFAINENQQCLRILTTSYDNSGNPSNNLYIFDDKMKLTGSLTDIADGEEIYAARYFNNTAYFITYRNTDPLFVADLSNPSDPKILGSLEVTGFSEYLQLWDDHKLLGIGYETDPDSGVTKGLKMVMFDISDPMNLKVIDSIVLDNYIYSPALYDYKCVLADTSANLIGFAMELKNTDAKYSFDYGLYSWENDHFTKKLNVNLTDHTAYENLRGIYINDYFYLADFHQIISFDRTADYKKTDELLLK